MIPSMPNLSRWIFVLAAAASLVVARAGEDGVLSPSKRQEALDKGKQLLATMEIAAPEADPFYYAELGAKNEKAPPSEIAKPAAAGPAAGGRRGQSDLGSRSRSNLGERRPGHGDRGQWGYIPKL